jgi:predicted nucleotidyltransferase component of viral defense system
MLKTIAIPVNLLQVLTDLQEKVDRAGFALAGGTSLALRLGHRLSIDLDFFTTIPFEPASLAQQLSLDTSSITGLSQGTLQASRNGVKLEFLRHDYPKLGDDEIIEGVKMWSLQDLVSMKLNAINNRGSKKDFYDIVALLDQYSLATMLSFYKEKYHPASLLMVIRSLAWFEDAEQEPDPISLSGFSWAQIKEKMAIAIRTLS